MLVQIVNAVGAFGLFQELRAVVEIFRNNVTYRLRVTYTVDVISKALCYATRDKRSQFPALPRKRLAEVAERIPERIIRDALSIVRREPILNA